MFLRNTWYVAAWTEEVTDKPLARMLLGEQIVLFRTTEGATAALQDRCCHRAAALSMGTVVEKGLMCGYHGLVFNGAGKCVDVPGQSRIPERACVRSYPTVEKNEIVWIWMGEADRADPSLIIDYSFNDDPKNWPHKRSMMWVQSNYMLLVDNLMDMSHLAYVHSRTIGGDPKAHHEALMKITRTPTGLKYIRWMLDSAPPPTYVEAVGFKGRVDRWQEFEYCAPSNILMFTGAVDANTGAYDQGKREGGLAIRVFHGITPETETTSLYFWASANGYRTDDPEATEQLHQRVDFTFAEDKAFIEEQQKRIAQIDQTELVEIDSDGARLQMARFLKKRIDDENEQRSLVKDQL
jgi:phenylpropionate dioxygenase-like ring-hydroxylating dioxygenase large terminal subunit